MKKTMLLFTIAAIMISCNNEPKSGMAGKKDEAMPASETKQERNKKIIMASMDAFAKRDIDGMLKDAAPVYTEFGDETMPPSTNIDSTKMFINMLVKSFENYAATNVQYAADGDYVIFYADWSGTFKNDLMGIKATGKPVKYKDCDIFKFNDEGKITEHHSVQNLGALLMAGNSMKP
jgi:predicted ester cyclase